ncbi:hypothetical protein MUU75_17940 [Pseudoxanthomonas mexicana]|nr:hypothetical protein [Pseudoxanthomonas mexicana]UOV04929.1 hypothetical protein MUU75_17940 [Pseudoxanthomonas mexicana]
MAAAGKACRHFQEEAAFGGGRLHRTAPGSLPAGVFQRQMACRGSGIGLRPLQDPQADIATLLQPAQAASQVLRHARAHPRGRGYVVRVPAQHRAQGSGGLHPVQAHGTAQRLPHVAVGGDAMPADRAFAPATAAHQPGDRLGHHAGLAAAVQEAGLEGMPVPVGAPVGQWHEQVRRATLQAGQRKQLAAALHGQHHRRSIGCQPARRGLHHAGQQRGNAGRRIARQRLPCSHVGGRQCIQRTQACPQPVHGRASWPRRRR